MVKKICLALAAVIVLFLGWVAIQPSDYVISRDILISAPAERIYPYLNNTKLAERWGPWREVDPDAKMSYSGPEAGPGSKSSWDGGKQLGTGSATIVESVPNERVVIRLEYVKPMNMTQESTYLVRPESGGRSKVTWRVTGKNTFMGRFMCTFFDMDKVVGGMFEKGLSNLKSLVESQRS